MPSERAIPSRSPAWCGRIVAGTANTASSPGAAMDSHSDSRWACDEVGVRERAPAAAREGVLREVRPEPVGREHGLQARGRGRRLADDGARRREQRDAGTRREALAVANRDDRGVDDLDADGRHRQRTWRLRSTRLSR